MTSRPRFPPLPHQIEGTAFLRERDAAALFDEQGLGKTKQLIDTIAQEIIEGVLDGALVVCPNTLKTTWAEEIQKHSQLRYVVFGSGRRTRRSGFSRLRAQVYVINYEAVAAEVASLKALLRFKRLALVLDESHRIKTPTAKVTRALHDLRRFAGKRIIMTGTPVANKPEDLWSQFYFLDDGETLGETPREFRKQYLPNGKEYVHLNDLRKRVGMMSLRRVKEGTVELPSKTFSRVCVHIEGEQHRLYHALRDELAIWVKGLEGNQILENAENILARLVRLAQLASNPRLLDWGYQETPAKFGALDQILSQILDDEREKVIVWSSFVSNVMSLQERYALHQPRVLHGSMTTKERDRAVADFRENPHVRLLVGNPAAAREGLTLTEARTAIYVDRTFNLVDYLQSQDRIHRLSQQRPCHIVLLLAKDTIDEFIDYSLEQKLRLAHFAQGDVDDISDHDRALRKPALLRALLAPGA